MSAVKRIALWSGPRNVSTAMMYSFAQRLDTQVVDEPLFGWFLKHTGVARPSREESLATMETDPELVQQQLQARTNKPVFFMKHMANHLAGLNWDFLLEYHNVILTRHPADVLTSYTRHIEEPTLLDLAYAYQTQLVGFLNDHKLQPIVLDSKEVRIDPRGTLERLCAAIEIEFDECMLQWEAGARPEDGVWAKYWYHNVHRSTGFAPYEPKHETVPQHLQDLEQECLVHYQQLRKYLI